MIHTALYINVSTPFDSCLATWPMFRSCAAMESLHSHRFHLSVLSSVLYGCVSFACRHTIACRHFLLISDQILPGIFPLLPQRCFFVLFETVIQKLQDFWGGSGEVQSGDVKRVY